MQTAECGLNAPPHWFLGESAEWLSTGNADASMAWFKRDTLEALVVIMTFPLDSPIVFSKFCVSISSEGVNPGLSAPRQSEISAVMPFCAAYAILRNSVLFWSAGVTDHVIRN